MCQSHPITIKPYNDNRDLAFCGSFGHNNKISTLVYDSDVTVSISRKT